LRINELSVGGVEGASAELVLTPGSPARFCEEMKRALMGTAILLARKQAELPALKRDMVAYLADLDSGERATAGEQYLE
jgi:hypothetical protein